MIVDNPGQIQKGYITTESRVLPLHRAARK
jgi:hypothetical protein